MNQALLDKIQSEQFRKDDAKFGVGDSVKVHTKVVEGDKERIQIFSGVVIGKRGRGLNETFTVRRISYGEGVERIFPFCEVKNGANILVFPNLDAGNISYKLVQQLGGGEVIGPFLMGIRKPANVLQRTCTVDDIVNTVALTALEAQAFMENSSTYPGPGEKHL